MLVFWMVCLLNRRVGYLLLCWALAFFGGGVLDAQEVALESALDASELQWKTSASLPWQGRVDSTASDGEDLAYAALSEGGTSWVETSVTGPGILRFRWQTARTSYEDRFEFLVDDILVDRLEPSAGWRSAEMVISPGSHRLRWSIYHRRAEDTQHAYLDSISFSQGEVSTLSESLGESVGLVYTAGDALWTAQSEVTHDGVSAAASGVIERDQVTTLRVLTFAPGEISFWWKVSSQETQDFSSFFVRVGDTATYEGPSISGETDWTQVSVPILEPGWSSWEFARNGDLGSGANRVWLDDVAFMPSQNPQLAEGLDVTPESLIDGDWELTMDAGRLHDGEDAVQSDPMAGGSSTLTFGATGPGVLRFWSKKEAGTNRPLIYSNGYTIDLPENGDIVFGDTWHVNEVLLPPGPGLVRWYSGQAYSGLPGRALLDELTLLRPVSLAEALETSLPLTMGGDAPWVGMPTINAWDEEDVVMSGRLHRGQEAWIDTTVTGPARLEFSWRQGRSTMPLALNVDGETMVQYDTTASSDPWERPSAFIGHGEHVVRWYSQALSSHDGYGGAWLDKIEVHPDDGLRIAEALDLPIGHPGVASKGTSPRAQLLVTSDGEDAVQLYEDTLLSMGLSGPSVLDFRYRGESGDEGSVRIDLSSDYPSHSLTCRDDNAFVWTRTEMVIPETEKSVRWSAYSDYAFLDQVQVRPAVTVEEALGPEFSFTTGGILPWVGYPLQVTPGGAAVNLNHAEHLAYNEAIEVGWIETEIEGPGTLRYWASSTGGQYEQIILDTGERVSGESGLRLLVDGVEVAIHSNRDRQAFTHRLAPGMHTVRWAASKEYRDHGSGAWLAGVEMDRTSPTLADALDLDSGQALQTVGPYHWSIVQDEEAEGGSALQLPLTDTSDIGMVILPITGPKLVEFRWKVDPVGTLHVYEGLGRLLPNALVSLHDDARDDEWEVASVFLPQDRHGLTIYCRGGSVLPTLWVDSVRVNEPMSLQEAADTVQPLVSGGETPPIGFPSRAAFDGMDHVAFTGTGMSWIETTISGPGTLHYHLRDQGQVAVSVDGVVLDGVDSLVDGSPCSLTLREGAQTIRWEAAGGPSEDAYAFLDQLWFEGSLVTGALDWNGGEGARIVGDWGLSADARRGESSLYFEVPAGSDSQGQAYKVFVPVGGGETLSFWAKTLLTESPNATFKIAFDDPGSSLQIFESTDGAWRFHEVPVPPDATRATLQFSDWSGSCQCWVDQLTVSPAVSLTEALDGALVWTSQGSYPWRTLTSEDSREGNSMVRALFDEDEGEAVLETVVEGPGVVAFSWRAEDRVTLNWSINGDYMFIPLNDESRWERIERSLGPGSHTLRWSASSRRFWYGRAWLDAVSFTPDYLNEALDTDSRLISGYSSTGWMLVDGDAAYDGEDALRGALEGGGEHRLTIPLGEIESESLVSLWTNATLSGLTIRFSGVLSSHNFPVKIRPGWQEYQFLARASPYQKLVVNANLRDDTPTEFLTIDRLSVSPALTDLPLNEVLESPGVFETSETQPWRGRAFAPESGPVSFAQATGGNGAEEPSWIETTLTGPGTASFRWKGNGVGELTLNGGSAYELPSSYEWSDVQITIPDGEQTLRWSFHSPTSSFLDALGALDAFQFQEASFPMQDAVELSSEASLNFHGRVPQIQQMQDGNDLLKIESGNLDWRHTGPGTVKFSYALPLGCQLVLYVDGQIQQVHSGPIDWTNGDLTIPTGQHTITWSVKQVGAATAQEALFDAFAFRAVGGVNTLDHITEIPLTSGGDSSWYSEETQHAPAGNNRLSSGSIEAGEESWLESTVTGPGQLGFWWKLGSYEGDRLTLTLNGESILDQQSGYEWECVQRYLPPGEHTLQWVYRKHGASAFGEGQAWLDGIKFHENVVPLHEGVDYPNILMARSPACWRLDTTESHDGQDSLVASADETSIDTILTSTPTVLSRRTLLSYWWKPESENSGTIAFSSPSPEILPGNDGEDGWRQERRILQAGPATLEWKHEPASYPLSPGGMVWLDEISLMPIADVSLTEALDTESLSQLSWKTSPEAPWTGEAIDTAYDGVDQAVSARSSAGIESWLETTVVGPGELTFVWKRGDGYSARLMVDGEAVPSMHSPGTDSWKEVHLLLSPGAHTIRWTSESEAIFLDHVTFGTIHEGLCQALDFVPDRGIVIISGSPGMLVGQSDMTADGEDALAIQQDARITLSGISSGQVNVVARYAGDQGSSHVVLSAQGLHDSARTAGVWNALAVQVDEIDALVEIRVGTPSSSDAVVWLDQLSIIASEPSLSEAFDTGLSLLVSEPPSWSPRHDNGAFDGTDSLESSSTSYQNPRWIETTVQGPGRIRFMHEGRVFWAVNGIPFVDVTDPAFRQESEVGWKQAEILVPDGDFTIRWVPYSDRAKLDRLTFLPETGLLTFPDWLVNHDLEGPSAMANADPNEDGITNLVAWAFGLSPVAPVSETELPIGAVESTPFGDCLIIDYYRRTDAQDQYRPQFSENLDQWSALFSDESVTDLGNGWQRVRVRDRVPLRSEGRRFGRVEIHLSE